MVLPLLAAQFCFILLIRVVPIDLSVNPFREQLTMGLQQGGWVAAVVLFLLLSIIFLLTAVTFVPVGQLCGRLMERRKNLRAYGLNLLGSLVGVVMMLVASRDWSIEAKIIPLIVGSSAAVFCMLSLANDVFRRPADRRGEDSSRVVMVDQGMKAMQPSTARTMKTTQAMKPAKRVTAVTNSAARTSMAMMSSSRSANVPT